MIKPLPLVLCIICSLGGIVTGGTNTIRINFQPSPIDQVYALSSDWLLLANDYNEEINRKIYADNKDEWDSLYPYRLDQLNGVEPLNWSKLKRRQYLYVNGYVKFSTQHLWMRDSASFTIISTDDPAYASPIQPIQAISWIASLGDAQWSEDCKLDNDSWRYQIGHYAYLRLPHPLHAGKRYIVRQVDGRISDFVFAGAGVSNRCIKVNQCGYLPDAAHKYAYLGGWVPTVGPIDYSAFNEFMLVDSVSGSVAHVGEIRVKSHDYLVDVDNDPASYAGEHVYELDFSAMTQPGNYRIFIPGLGYSWPFIIGTHALGEAFYVATRGFYHQRCGCSLSMPYTAWERGACHTQQAGECGFVGDNLNWIFPDGSNALDELSDFDIIRATADDQSLHNVYGSWHDAADYDRRASHNIPAWDLLLLFDINRQAFTDGQLNIPESGNGIPDLLDEACWGLKAWKRSQSEQGAVTGRIETFHHPQHKGMPDQDTDRFYMSIPDRKSTFLYAGGAAMYARMIEPYSQVQHQEYLESAQRAYSWASIPSNSRNGHTVELEHDGSMVEITLVESDADILFPACMAAVNLLLATGDSKYLDDINQLYGAEASRTLPSYPNYQYYYAPIFLLAAKDIPGLSADIKTTARSSILELAAEPLGTTATEPYRHAWRTRSRRWGWALAPYWARYLVLAHALTGEERYREAALLNIDFHLGCNPLGMVQTTGIGHVYTPTIQDAETRRDGIVDPVPGLTSYGVVDIPNTFINEGYNINVPDIETGNTLYTVCLLPESMNPEHPNIPHWRRIAPSGWVDPICNEFTVPQTTGPVALVLGAFLGNGWIPDDSLKQRIPKSNDKREGYLWMP